MRSRYRVTLGGTHLDSIDSNLLILDVSHSSTPIQPTSYRTANLDGYDYKQEYIEKTTVTITFELHIYDIAKRNEACQAVNKWASAGGTLKTNDRADQQLYYTRCEQYANIESAKNWTDPLTLVFSTTYVPYWCSSTAKALTLTGKSAKGTMKLDGNVGYSTVYADVTASATVTSFQITAGTTTLKLTGISVPAGKVLSIDYVRSRYLRVRVDGKSVMAKVDPSSSDQLLVPCGQNSTISIVANNKVTAKITARGRWLW